MNLDLSALSTSDQAQLAAILQKLQPNDATSGNAVQPRATKPRKRRTQVKYLTEAEWDALLRSIESPRDRAIFTVVYKRGLRAGEVKLLQLSDYNARDERLNVTRLKGSKGGSYHLTSAEVRALRPWLKIRGNEPGPLFPSRKGKGISQQQLDKLIKRYGAKAGIPREKCHMHSLKHSCGTHLLNRGEPLDEIQDHLGHRNPQNTAIYADFGDTRRIQRDKRLRDW